MFTIKQAARRVGVSEAVLRVWERRYEVVAPRRSDSGYRLYDDGAIAVLTSMRRLVDDGWPPAEAARHVMSFAATGAPASAVPPPRLTPADTTALTEAFLEAAAVVDPTAVEEVLERAFALGPFETVAQTWLMPTLVSLGEAWADGWVDVAGEHAAAHAVMRHLGQSFSVGGAAGGPRVVVALPPGALHELGALTFATMVRRRGLPVVYLGADLPAESWVRAVRAFPTRAAVLVVPTEADRAAAQDVASALRDTGPEVTVAAGGGASANLAPGVVALPHEMTEAVDLLESLPA